MNEGCISRHPRWLGVFLAAASWIGLAFVSPEVLLAADAAVETTSARQPAKMGYASILSGCGRRERDVHFVKAFGGHWPIPAPFVLVDTTDDQLEYSDLAFPWNEPSAPSNVFLGTKAKFLERWGWLDARKYVPAGAKCSVHGRRYEYVDEFAGPAVLFMDRDQYLLLVGPIANAASESLACYAAVLAERGRGC